MTLIARNPWTSQPQIPTRINWGNPITAGLVSALDAMTGTDRVTGRLMTLVSNPSKAPGVKGIGYVGNNASYGYVTIPQTLGARVTIVYVASRVARTANANLIAGLGATSGNQLCGFQVQNTQSNRALLRQTNGGGASTRNYNINTSSTGVPAVLALSFSDSSSTNSKVYWNGTLDQGTPLDGSSGANTTFDSFGIGGVKRSTDTGADTGNNGALALLFNRVLSDTEIKSLSDNPWQIFAPLRPTLWVPSASGGGSFQPAWAHRRPRTLGAGVI